MLLVVLGRIDNSTVAKTGTSTMMADHDQGGEPPPLASRPGLPGRGFAISLGVGVMVVAATWLSGGHAVSTFRICRYRTVEMITSTKVMMNAMATPGPV